MRYLGIILMMLFVLPALAQDDLMMETVNLTASDDLVLEGDIYMPEEVSDQSPIVITLHMLGGNRGAYEPIIPDLVSAGYMVLNVDMRGHGDTGGSRDWELAQADVTAWVEWLRENGYLSSQGMSIIGASIGANIALMGCADNDDCAGAVALSPGLDYVGVQPESALVEGLSDRSALLIATHDDSYSAETITQMFMNATGDVTARLYAGRSHGTNLFRTDYDSVSAMILAWLNEQFALDAEDL